MPGTDQATALPEKYEMLRKTLANYLLLQVDTFVSGAGMEAIGPAMSILTDKKAELKVREIKKQDRDPLDGLSHHLVESMGETFNSDYEVESKDSSSTVKLSRCGCIESVLKESDSYSLSKQQVRAIFCGSCIGSYRKAAETLGLRFKGSLSEQGCTMKFIHPTK
jgi:hypothetical protein